MGFLDNLKERLGFGGGDYYDDYYEDDEYDDSVRRSSRRSRDYDDDGYQAERRPRAGRDYEGEPQGILGNTSRPKVESVSVYTRSGHLVDSNSDGRDSAAPAPYERNTTVTGDSGWTDSRLNYTPAASATYAAPASSTTTMRPIPTQTPRTSARGGSGTNLPPYVLRPTAYDDCQTVIRRVRTNQPVVLAFSTTEHELAKRILDFCFGFACGIGGRVEELGERTFCVLPDGVELTDSAIEKLVRDGVMEGSRKEEEEPSEEVQEGEEEE